MNQFSIAELLVVLCSAVLICVKTNCNTRKSVTRSNAATAIFSGSSSRPEWNRVTYCCLQKLPYKESMCIVQYIQQLQLSATFFQFLQSAFHFRLLCELSSHENRFYSNSISCNNFTFDNHKREPGPLTGSYQQRTEFHRRVAYGMDFSTAPIWKAQGHLGSSPKSAEEFYGYHCRQRKYIRPGIQQHRMVDTAGSPS